MLASLDHGKNIKDTLVVCDMIIVYVLPM
jgi:hypothetical protein